jgi:hypothetical protein
MQPTRSLSVFLFTTRELLLGDLEEQSGTIDGFSHKQWSILRGK